MSKRAALSTPIERLGTMYVVALLREELGRRIKVARTTAGLNQRELAALIGLKNSQDVSRYERGRQQVPDFRLDLIAEATGRPRSFFVRDPDEPEAAAPVDITGLIADVTEMRTMVAHAVRLLERLDAGSSQAESG